jgi:methylmalonyl-CoA mutase
MTAPNTRLLAEFTPPTAEAWRAEAERTLNGKPLEKLVTQTYEGITVQPIYRQDDAAGVPYLDSLPGFAPYLRGAGVAAPNWLICQEIPYGSAAAFNEAIRHDLERGQTAIQLTPDRATQQGQDPDEAAMDDVGREGLSISTIDDLATALAGLDLARAPLFVGAASATMPLAALLFAMLKKEGYAIEDLRGNLDMDPLGVLAQTGKSPCVLPASYDMMAHLLRWSVARAPQMGVIAVHGKPYGNAGAGALQEIAFLVATGLEYIRAMQARGLTVDDVAPRMRFVFTIGPNYFMEVAKLRAARVVWAKVIKALGGRAASQRMSLHARTTRLNKTTTDPWVNILRTTVETFAGAAGGAEAIHTGHFDETAGLPDEFSRRLARNTQLILQNEAHLTRVLDPAGGSWYVEKLTDEIGRGAWVNFQQIEAQGGMLTAVRQAFPQEQVARTAAERAKNVAVRKDSLVGTNRYPNLQETPPEPMVVDLAALHQARSEDIIAYRGRRGPEVAMKIEALRQAESATVMDAAIEAALAGATVSELARALWPAAAQAETVTPLATVRLAEPFEGLRHFAASYAAQNGARPAVFLANIGPLADHKPRADFSADFFQVGGFKIISSPGSNSPEAAAAAAIQSEAPIVAICGKDEVYPAVVPPLARALKSARPEIKVILAGLPKEHLDGFRQAGVDEFIHLRADLVAILTALQQEL